MFCFFFASVALFYIFSSTAGGVLMTELGTLPTRKIIFFCSADEIF